MNAATAGARAIVELIRFPLACSVPRTAADDEWLASDWEMQRRHKRAANEKEKR